MATAETLVWRAEEQRTANKSAYSAVLITGTLTALAVVIHGYHPYVEDGGLYLAVIKKALDPTLYPTWSSFVTVQCRFSFFASAVACLVRMSSLSLMALLFLLFIGSFWATLLSGWLIASRFYDNLQARLGATALLALCLTMPIAGTSLMLMDPYVTARSISTPCALFALLGAIDIRRAFSRESEIPWRSVVLCLASLLLAELAHPLMGTYALECVLLLLCLSLPGARSRMIATSVLLLFAFAAASCLYIFAPPQAPQYIRVAQTRTYWFINWWHWYEQLGWAAPLVILAKFQSTSTSLKSDIARWFAQMAIVAGVAGVTMALLFARVTCASYAVARLQPLRIFQMVYIVAILLAGGLLGERILKLSLWRWSAFIALCSAGVLLIQLQTFPQSPHLELPWTYSQNAWEQGFIWIKEHTPKNSVVLLDSNYITQPGEDTQNFRAIAERSTLPDYSKDGGVAAIVPDLAGMWTFGEMMQRNLDSESDVERISRLRSTKAEWLVLPSNTFTTLACPFVNQSIRVCEVKTDYNLSHKPSSSTR